MRQLLPPQVVQQLTMEEFDLVVSIKTFTSIGTSLTNFGNFRVSVCLKISKSKEL
jgi:hypothetical protein